MHFCGPDQLHGFEERLTTDIYPADFGWVPDWTHPAERPRWYHNMSSVLDAGPCVRTNQLDFDDDVTFAARQKIFDVAREKAAVRDTRPFCMVVSLTHPHDPYAITREYWDLYRDEDIDLLAVRMDFDASDPHSRRLRAVCEVDRTPPSDAQFGAALDQCGFTDDTIVIVTADRGDMLGERGLWYKMTFFEGACRVPAAMTAAAALSWCAATASAAEAAACRDVRMAGPGWTDIEATDALAGVVLKALGYRQSVSNLSVPITYQGLKKGQIDVFPGN
ncbi:sulfatase-like hydrolase/transferase [Burkholderia humptydooensis]|uniref:Sulfatase-like hydrolase/transferase n=2 Tax=Burkholderia humptydooensis TaxID=430531 RepID=A0A7U4PAY4_9BURK|nr:substrate binding domain of ABC-type glycine betaine transport system family protein [Burkholderia sp. 2002721687]ALX46196.1 choline-sulfatase [Burkholderia humptydooensis]EIP87237.1 choline sulfatase [Burkholderia humptydooensis MSMB43]QPS47702.1 sulfatase-like hydrolase/transferase [Burkholderia humptydooensis]